MSTFNRSNYMRKFSIDNQVECDLGDNNWDLFKMNKNVISVPITQSDIGRPDYLSYRIYNTVEYWWILGKLNNISDWWNDINDFMLNVKTLGK